MSGEAREDATASGVAALRMAADNMPLRRPGQPWAGAARWLHRRADAMEKHLTTPTRDARERRRGDRGMSNETPHIAEIAANPLDRIRAAEWLIRERAEAATEGPWRTYADPHNDSIVFDQYGAGVKSLASEDVVCYAGQVYSRDAEHIATWHPTAALAVADMLHQAAMDLWAHGPLCVCGTGCDACDDNLWEPHARAALALADTLFPPDMPSADESEGSA